jgi:hypothetical protein
VTSVIESFDAFVHHRHHDQDGTPAPAATQENHMSKLTEAATAIAAIADNKLVVALAEAGVGKLLAPGEITFVTGLIASFEHERASAPQQAVAAEPPAQPVA